MPTSSHLADGRLWPEVAGPLLPDEVEALHSHRLQHLGASESWDEYWDEVSGGTLPAAQVKRARAEEVAFMEDWRCWQRVSKEEAYTCGGGGGGP